MDQFLFPGESVHSDRILYTPSSFAKNNLFYLQETGTLAAQKTYVNRRKDLSSYLFFIVLKGSGTLRYQNVEYTLHTGNCVFLDCRQEHFHQSSPDLWTLEWAHFNGPNMDAIYAKYQERGGLPCFHAREPEQFHRILDDLFQVASSNAYVRDMKLCEKITSLLTLLMEEAWNPSARLQTSRKQGNLQKIKAFLDGNFTQKISLDLLSEQFYINKFYLSKIFVREYGVTINQYLVQLRITYAKRLLRFSDLPIEQIAAQCGIPDPNYFSRLFKKIEGVTPGEFRRRW